MKDVFLTKEVVDALTPYGVTMEALQTWLKLGFVSPSIQKGTGRGTRHLFSFEDVLFIAVFKRMVDLGGGTRGEVAFFLDDKTPGSSLAKARRSGNKFLQVKESVVPVVGDIVETEDGHRTVRRSPKQIERLMTCAFSDEITIERISKGDETMLFVINLQAMERQIRAFLIGGTDES